VGQFYFGDIVAKWVSFKSALTRGRYLIGAGAVEQFVPGFDTLSILPMLAGMGVVFAVSK
jgi:hypothetical protein